MNNYANSRGFSDETSRPVAIRAGLSVQELKMMTAMRMAQNSGGEVAPTVSGPVVHNASSSYQTANPQQLRAAGIQPVVINDRHARNRPAARSLQLAGQFSAEQYNSGSFSGARNPPVELNSDVFADYSSAKVRPQANSHLPAVMARPQDMPQRRRGDGQFVDDRRFASQQAMGASLRFAAHDNHMPHSSSMDHSHRSLYASEGFSSRFAGGTDPLAPPSTRSNSVVSLQHNGGFSHEDHLYSKSNLHGDQFHGSFPQRTALASAGRPEVPSTEDDFDVRGPKHDARFDGSFRGDASMDALSSQFDTMSSLDWQLAPQSSGSSKVVDYNGRRVSLLKSRSEALFPAEQLSAFQSAHSSSRATSQFSLPDLDSPRSSGMYSVASEAALPTLSPSIDVEAPPNGTPKSRFPLLKSKTAPKISGVHFGSFADSPSGSPSMKLFGRKKGSPGPHGDLFLASEVAEAVLQSVLLDGDADLSTLEDMKDDAPVHRNQVDSN